MYGLETLQAPSDEIRLMAVNLLLISTKNCLETLLSTSDEFRIFVNVMQLNCAQ
jgi:hypothetical protein